MHIVDTNLADKHEILVEASLQIKLKNFSIGRSLFEGLPRNTTSIPTMPPADHLLSSELEV